MYAYIMSRVTSNDDELSKRKEVSFINVLKDLHNSNLNSYVETFAHLPQVFIVQDDKDHLYSLDVTNPDEEFCDFSNREREEKDNPHYVLYTRNRLLNTEDLTVQDICAAKPLALTYIQTAEDQSSGTKTVFLTKDDEERENIKISIAKNDVWFRHQTTRLEYDASNKAIDFLTDRDLQLDADAVADFDDITGLDDLYDEDLYDPFDDELEDNLSTDVTATVEARAQREIDSILVLDLTNLANVQKDAVDEKTPLPKNLDSIDRVRYSFTAIFNPKSFWVGMNVENPLKHLKKEVLRGGGNEYESIKRYEPREGEKEEKAQDRYIQELCSQLREMGVNSKNDQMTILYALTQNVGGFAFKIGAPVALLSEFLPELSNAVIPNQDGKITVRKEQGGIICFDFKSSISSIPNRDHLGTMNATVEFNTKEHRLKPRITSVQYHISDEALAGFIKSACNRSRQGVHTSATNGGSEVLSFVPFLLKEAGVGHMTASSDMDVAEALPDDSVGISRSKKLTLVSRSVMEKMLRENYEKKRKVGNRNTQKFIAKKLYYMFKKGSEVTLETQNGLFSCPAAKLSSVTLAPNLFRDNEQQKRVRWPDEPNEQGKLKNVKEFDRPTAVILAKDLVGLQKVLVNIFPDSDTLTDEYQMLQKSFHTEEGEQTQWDHFQKKLEDAFLTRRLHTIGDDAHLTKVYKAWQKLRQSINEYFHPQNEDQTDHDAEGPKTN